MLSCNFQSKLIGLLFVVLFSLAFVPNAAAQKQEKLVETLDILGNRRLTDEVIIKHIKTRPENLFDEKQVKEDLQSLLALDLFHKKNTRFLVEEGVRGGVSVIFEVQELPIIFDVDFGCLKFVTKKELIDELRGQNVKIEAEEVYATENIQKARRIILEYLVNRGFTEAKVEAYEEEISATTLKIGFHIKELPSENEDCCCEN